MTIILTFYSEVQAGAAEAVVSKLRADPSAAVEVRINSPGGSVAEGIAIFNALKPRKPTVFIDGVAASIASLIAMAGHRVIAAENAIVMIHDPWVGTQGNSSELRRTAEVLDKHRDAMVSGYARTGIARPDLIELLAAETWMTADEALQLGFVDEIAEPLSFAAHAPECFSGYYKTPKELLMRTALNGRGTRASSPPPSEVKPDKEPGTDLSTADENKTLDAFRKGLSSDAVTKAAHDSVMGALRERNETIALVSRGYMENPTIRDFTMKALADPSMSFEHYGQRLLGMLGAGVEPLAGGMGVDSNGVVRMAGNALPNGSADGGDFVQAMSDTLAIRAGVKLSKPHPGSRDAQGMGLMDIARACVSRAGMSTGWGPESRGGLIRSALSTSDFPMILENSLGKALRNGYEVEPATYEAWTSKVLVPDFKPQSRVILGSAPSLLPVAEGGEYSFGSMDEDKSVPYSVGKFGRMVKFTWEALVNDDLDAFLRVTKAMGQAAARSEGDQIYSSFADTGGAGPLMQDQKTLFHIAHGNLAPAAAALNADSLAAGRILLRRQTAVGGGALNLQPRFLLVAPEHEQAAEILLAAAARGVSQGGDNTLVPAWLAQLELVVEARLAENAFYLLTSPDSVDTLERAWLDVDNGPKIEEEDTFGVDAKTYKVRHVFGSRWLDWRGAVKVPLSG